MNNNISYVSTSLDVFVEREQFFFFAKLDKLVDMLHNHWLVK